MGIYYDDEPHFVEGKFISTLRKLPESDGGLYKVTKRKGGLQVNYFSITPSMRRTYTSGRNVIIYNMELLSDGKYCVHSVDKEGRKIKHFFQIIGGNIQSELDDIAQLDNMIGEEAVNE